MPPRLAIGFNPPLSLALRLCEETDGLARPVFLVDSASGTATAAQLAMLRRLAEVVDLAGTAPGAGGADAVVASAPQALVTFLDERMVDLALAAARLGVPFHAPGTARALVDKQLQRQLLAGAGIPVPRFACIEPGSGTAALAHALEAVGPPAVLKPCSGSGSRDSNVVSSPRQLERAAGAVSEPMLLEQFLHGPGRAVSRFADYVSVEAVVEAGRFTPLVVSGRLPLERPLRERGLFVPSDLSPADAAAVVAAAGAAVRALAVEIGVMHVEVKLTDDGPRVIEVNGRCGGIVADLIELAGGDTSLTALAWRQALGEPVAPSALCLSGVGYSIAGHPPCAARTLRSVDGLPAVPRLPGVVEAQLHKHPGDTVDWRRGYRELVWSVTGSAGDHDELAAVLAEIDRLVVARFEDADGQSLPCVASASSAANAGSSHAA